MRGRERGERSNPLRLPSRHEEGGYQEWKEEILFQRIFIPLCEHVS